MKEFVTKKSNYVVCEDIIETFRNSFIDFVFVFSYFHDVMHLGSCYMDNIKTKIINDNPRFLNMYNMQNVNYLIRSINDINDNNNRYNEYYFDKYQTVYRMHDNGNFFRLYSTLVNWNNNPLYNKDSRNLHLFKTNTRKLRGSVTHDMTLYVRGLTWTGEKAIDTVADMANEIGEFDFKKLFKIDILSPRNNQFFRLMCNCYKNWLFRNSGYNGIENFSDISKLFDTDFFYDHIIDTLSLIHQKYSYEFPDNGTQYKESKIFDNYEFRIQTRKSLETYYQTLETENPHIYHSYGPYTNYKFFFENGTVKIISEKPRNFRQGITNGFGTSASNII